MRHKKRIPYCRLSRRKQRDKFIALRRKINNDKILYGGQYTTDHIPTDGNQWEDIYFLGSDGLTIWNAEIITASLKFWDVVENMAFSQSWEMLTPEEQESEADIQFDPIWHNGRRMSQMRKKIEQKYEKFGGMPFIEYKDKLAEDIVQHEPPDIYESFTTDRSYRYGIGLYIVIHAEEINRSIIEKAIHRFREAGETDWRAAVPVPRDELPQESANVAFSKVQWEPADS